MKIICPPSYHHNFLVATNATWVHDVQLITYTHLSSERFYDFILFAMAMM